MPPISNSPNTVNPDPINALQTMARQEGPLTYFPGPNMQLGQVLNSSPQTVQMTSSLASQNPQLGAALATHLQPQSSSLQQQPQQAAPPNVTTNIGPVGVGVGGPNAAGMAPGLQQQQSSLNQGMPPGAFPSVIGGARMQMANQMAMNKAGMKVQNPQMQKQMQMVMQQQQMNQQQQQQPTMLPPNKPGTPLGQMQPMMPDAMMMASKDAGGPGMPYAPPQQPNQRQPNPNQFLTQHQGGGHGGMVPSPVHQMPTSLSSSQMAPSPVGYMPSHSPQIVPSPASISSLNSQPPSGRPPTMGGAPSPGSALNTPMSLSNIQSPANRSQEDQAYLEKVKQLSKYIEPLRRLIARLDKEDNVDKKKELVKMKNLLDSLTNPNKRLPIETLLKCEQVLEKMELQRDPNVANTTPAPPIVQLPQTKEYNLCQPLYEAILAHMNLPTFHHTLQRTFGPAVSALLGEPVRYSAGTKRKRVEEDEFDIPDVLQGEIARLDRRFKVNINPIQHSGSKTVHLLCQLDDKNLPCVPPIMLTVPDNYPQLSPQCETDADEYISTQFLQTVHKNLITRLSKMAEQFSITTLLDTWEMSVRQACVPITTQGAVSP